MIYVDKTYEAMKAFSDHFLYLPKYPNDEEKDESEEYNDVLYKSIKDNFDYTVEKYGTTPLDKDATTPTIIWD